MLTAFSLHIYDCGCHLLVSPVGRVVSSYQGEVGIYTGGTGALDQRLAGWRANLCKYIFNTIHRHLLFFEKKFNVAPLMSIDLRMINDLKALKDQSSSVAAWMCECVTKLKKRCEKGEREVRNRAS